MDYYALPEGGTHQCGKTVWRGGFFTMFLAVVGFVTLIVCAVFGLDYVSHGNFDAVSMLAGRGTTPTRACRREIWVTRHTEIIKPKGSDRSILSARGQQHAEELAELVRSGSWPSFTAFADLS